MAASQTDRLDIFTWSSGTDTFTRTQMNTSHTNLEARAAAFDQTAATIPTAKTIDKYKGYFHYSTSNTDVGTLSYCNGAAWFEIGKYGTAVAIDGTLSDGSSTDVARADHKHSISSNTITTAMIQDDAVETAKINDLAVTTAKIADTAVTNAKLGSDLDASKITAGTLPIARIAAGAVVNDKLGSDIDAGKITAGTLPIARIADSAVTHEKIEDSAGLSVVGRSANSTGVVADITASSDHEVLRRSGTSVGFGTIANAGIAANAVTVDKIEEVAAHGILARVASTDGDLSELTSADEQVLGRTGGGNLAFGKVTNAQLAGSIESGKITSLVATKLTGTIDADRLPTDIALGTKTTGNYVATVAPATDSSLTVSGSGSETAAVVIDHDVSAASSVTNTDASAVQSITLDENGHITEITSKDMDNEFYKKSATEDLFDTFNVYGISYNSNVRNANTGKTIYIKSSAPTTGQIGDIWLDT